MRICRIGRHSLGHQNFSVHDYCVFISKLESYLHAVLLLRLREFKVLKSRWCVECQQVLWRRRRGTGEEATAELLALSWVLCSLFLPSRLCGSILVKWLLLVNTRLFFCKIDSRGVALIMPVASKDRTSRNARNGRICALDKKPAFWPLLTTLPLQLLNGLFNKVLRPFLLTLCHH